MPEQYIEAPAHEIHQFKFIVVEATAEELIDLGLNGDFGALGDGLVLEGTDMMDAFAGHFGKTGTFPGSDVGGEGATPAIPTPESAFPGEGAGEGGGGLFPDLSGVDGSMVGFGDDADAPWENVDLNTDYLDKRFGAGNWKENSDGDVEVGNSTFGRDVIYHPAIGDPKVTITTIVVETQKGHGIFSTRELAHDAAKEIAKDMDKDNAADKKRDAENLKAADKAFEDDDKDDRKDGDGAKDDKTMENPDDVDETGGMTVEEIGEALAKLMNGSGSDPLVRQFEDDGNVAPPPGQSMEDFIGGMNDPITMKNIYDVAPEEIGEEVLVGLEDPLINPVNPADDLFA